jgi:hypothetical protein
MKTLFKYAIVLALGLAVGFYVHGLLSLEDVAKLKWLDEINVIINKPFVAARPAAVAPSTRRPQRFSTRISTIGLPDGSGRSTDGARSSLLMGAASMPNPRWRRSRNCFSPRRLPRRPPRRRLRSSFVRFGARSDTRGRGRAALKACCAVLAGPKPILSTCPAATRKPLRRSPLPVDHSAVQRILGPCSHGQIGNPRRAKVIWRSAGR